MSDRQQILQRRALLISSAMVTIAGCGHQGEQPPSGAPNTVVVPTASASASAAAAALPAPTPAPVRLAAPTRTPPPAEPPRVTGTGTASRVAAGSAERVRNLSEKLAALESGFDGSCQGDCQTRLEQLGTELRSLQEDIQRLASPLCPPSSPEGIAVVNWQREHGAYLQERIALLDQAAAEVARRRNMEQAWKEARRPQGGPMALPCLSCAQW